MSNKPPNRDEDRLKKLLEKADKTIKAFEQFKEEAEKKIKDLNLKEKTEKYLSELSADKRDEYKKVMNMYLKIFKPPKMPGQKLGPKPSAQKSEQASGRKIVKKIRATKKF